MAVTSAQLRRACAYGGESGALILKVDWSGTPLGPIERWSPTLLSTVSLCLGTSFPMTLQWGPELVQLYNDAAIGVFGRKHPEAMGRPAHVNFPELWEMTTVQQVVDEVRRTGTPWRAEDLRIPLQRRGFLEDAYFTFSLSPVLDEDGEPLGVLNTYFETTDRVLLERRLATMRRLAERTGEGGTIEQACRGALAALESDPRDLRFVLLYVVDDDEARLEGTIAIDRGHAVSPERVELASTRDERRFPWPIARVLETRAPVLIDELDRFFDVGRSVRRSVPPRQAIVLPVAGLGDARPAGALVVGLASRLSFDDAYRSFVELVAAQVATAIVSARAYQAARDRAETLAELDRAKTNFYGNVSHELRTPLTLVLGPVQDLLRGAHGPLTSAQREELEAVHRNALRLSKLVDALLDIAGIEAGRMEVVLEAVDVAAVTRELVSAFASSIAQAGLRLVLDVPPLPYAVEIDRGMWEKVVLNLLSNALKYTERGEIHVKLRHESGRLRLDVRDTGIGIAAEELPRVFERFYRVRGTKARSVEGTGIGLSLVQELVHLHGGTIAVASEPGLGSTFTVDLPAPAASARGLGEAPARVARESARAAGSPFVDEARRWEHDGAQRGAEPRRGAQTGPPRARILVADDNADVRGYLRRLLAPHYEVEAVSDGEEALRAARARPPDLVLTDVVMPNLDGFGLLRALRTDASTRAIPVVLLSARAGEEAALEGLGGGADDYLPKPFSARELLARVATHLELAKVRRDAAESALKDAFLGIVSHELRTPLTSLKLHVQIALRELERAGSPLAGRLAATRQSIARIEALVEDLLSVSAIQEGSLPLQRDRNDLVAIAREAAEEQILIAHRSVGLELPSGSIEANVDADRIRQVIANLLSNALKYSPPDRPVVLSLRRSGSEAILSVRDEGPGLTPDQVAHVFERFHRVPGIEVQSGSRTGLGLGLFICKAIVERHGGRIWVDTTSPEPGRAEAGRGSTFSVALPIAEPPPSRRARRPGRRARIRRPGVGDG